MNLARMGSRIKSQRERRKLRQADIASALQLSSQAVSKWERGENAPDIAVLVDLSRLLGVSIEWLLGGTAAETDTFPATVFCTSVNGFAKASTEMPPGEVAAWVNTIHYTVTEALRRFDGVPVKYVGDGFLGFFAGNDQARRALAAAREARRLVDSPDLIVALHRGDVYLGMLGHPDYERTDIIGETVNTAFLAMPWIANHCRSGIGVTGAVADALPKREPLARSGEIAVLGADEPVVIYEPAERRRV
jgi:class 3 adenylate cyclase